jgi:hypothetical protein
VTPSTTNLPMWSPVVFLIDPSSEEPAATTSIHKQGSAVREKPLQRCSKVRCWHYFPSLSSIHELACWAITVRCAALPTILQASAYISRRLTCCRKASHCSIASMLLVIMSLNPGSTVSMLANHVA